MSHGTGHSWGLRVLEIFNVYHVVRSVLEWTLLNHFTVSAAILKSRTSYHL